MSVESWPNSTDGCSPQGARRRYRRPHPWGRVVWVGKCSSRTLLQVSSLTFSKVRTQCRFRQWTSCSTGSRRLFAGYRFSELAQVCLSQTRYLCISSVVHSNGQQPLRAGRSLFQSCGQKVAAGTLHCLGGGRSCESGGLEGILQVRVGGFTLGVSQGRIGCCVLFATLAQHFSSSDTAARRDCPALLTACLTLYVW